MIFSAALGVSHDALEDIEARYDFHQQAGFFVNLPPDGVFQSLPGFKQASRDGPPAFQRLACALDQQRRIAVENDRSHAQQRVLRILAAHAASPNKGAILSLPAAPDRS